MPRIRQYADKYAEADFRKEIFRRLADRYECVSVRALSREIGACQGTLNAKIRNRTTSLEVGELQKIVPVLNPDPGIVLTLLGYTPQQIKRYKES